MAKKAKSRTRSPQGRRAKVRHKSPRHPKLALTGSLGSGKSTVLKHFKSLGWKTLSADQIVAKIYRQHGITKSKLKKNDQNQKAAKAIGKMDSPSRPARAFESS